MRNLDRFQSLFGHYLGFLWIEQLSDRHLGGLAQMLDLPHPHYLHRLFAQ